MKKRLLILALSIAMLSILFILTTNAASISVTVDGTPVDFTDAVPYIDSNGRTMIPLRAVADALGCEVEWDGTTGIATVTKKVLYAGESAVVKLEFYPKNSAYANMMNACLTLNSFTENCGYQTMDTNAVIRSDRTHLPIRYVAECFGYLVTWDASNSSVRITSGGDSKQSLDNFTTTFSSNPSISELYDVNWHSNGYRLSDTLCFSFYLDGILWHRTESGSIPYEGSYSLVGNVLTINYSKDQVWVYDYDPVKHQFISRTERSFAEQDYVNELGEYVPIQYERQILYPAYDCDFDPLMKKQYDDNDDAAYFDTIEISEELIIHLKEVVKRISSFENGFGGVTRDKWDNSSTLPDPMEIGRLISAGPITSFEKLKEHLTPYFSSTLVNGVNGDNPYGPYEINGKLYFRRGGVGITSLDLNSMKIISQDKDIMQISVDKYSSGDSLCGTVLYELILEDGLWKFNRRISSKSYPGRGRDADSSNDLV